MAHANSTCTKWAGNQTFHVATDEACMKGSTQKIPCFVASMSPQTLTLLTHLQSWQRGRANHDRLTIIPYLLSEPTFRDGPFASHRSPFARSEKLARSGPPDISDTPKKEGSIEAERTACYTLAPAPPRTCIHGGEASEQLQNRPPVVLCLISSPCRYITIV